MKVCVKEGGIPLFYQDVLWLHKDQITILNSIISIQGSNDIFLVKISGK